MSGRMSHVPGPPSPRRFLQDERNLWTPQGVVMNRRQWLAVWELNSSESFLEDKNQPVYGLPKVTVKLAIKPPLRVFPRPLRPAI